MNDIPHIIEAALLLLIAFLLGCIIGWFLRAKIFKKRQKPLPSKTVESVAKSETEILEKISNTGAKAVPAEKDSPKPTGTSPKLNVVASKPRKAAIAKVQKTKPSSNTNERASKGGEVNGGKLDADTGKSEAGKSEVGKSEATKHEAGKPEALSAPRAGGKDDLKKIKGVGPKLENTLNGLGIFHFDQISKWKRAEIDWVDDYLSFKGRIDRDDWIGQAKEFSS